MRFVRGIKLVPRLYTIMMGGVSGIIDPHVYGGITNPMG